MTDRRCTAKTSSTGERCKNRPIKGGTVCRYHGGSAPQVRAAATRRAVRDEALAEMDRLGIRIETTPEEALQEQLEEAYGNVAVLRELVSVLKPEVGPDGIADSTGNTRILNEARPHVLVAMYNHERDRLVEIAKIGVQLGLESRRIRLAEAQGRLIAEIFTRTIGDIQTRWGLSRDQVVEVRTLMAEHLRTHAALEGGES